MAERCRAKDLVKELGVTTERTRGELSPFMMVHKGLGSGGAGALPKKAPVEGYREEMYETLGEIVVEWLGGLAENMEHGSAKSSY